MSRTTTRQKASAARKGRQLTFWRLSLVAVLSAVAVVLIVKTFFVQTFYVPSDSMEPTLRVNDKILVQKVSFWAGSVHRGDLVVLDRPRSWPDDSQFARADNPAQHLLAKVGLFPDRGQLIRRVVGVGGDRVVCCKSGRLRINGTIVDEPYLADPTSTDRIRFDVRVPKGRLWVMGDDRGGSAGSPQHLADPGGGSIASSLVVGKAWLRLWPGDRAGFIDGTSAFATVPPP